VTAARAFQSANPGTAGDVLLSETLDKVKQHDQSVAVLNKSLADHPSNVVLLKLSALAMQGGDANRGADMLSNWLAKNPNDLAVRMEYAGFLMGRGDGMQAVPQYEAALKQNPNNAVALNNLGWLIQAKDPKRALVLLTQARKLSPGSPDIADTLGWLKVQQKDAAGGLELLNAAHSQKPKDGSITYHLAVALDANGKRDAARGLLKSLLASNVQFKERQSAVQLAAGWH
jgi:Flp pilus assembly protein TadD